ncbi:MAG TPA: hypothetical protein VIX86_08870 [Streptosporangiaceae bacterium]
MGAWLVGLGIIAAQAWHADRYEVAAVAFPSVTVYAALQLAVLAGFARSMHWAQPPVWCYTLFLASLLAVGVTGVVRRR